jgi:hypothetical protein
MRNNLLRFYDRRFLVPNEGLLKDLEEEIIKRGVLSAMLSVNITN